MLLCPPEEKAEREAANGVKQLDYISHLINYWRIREIRESHLLELHALAVEGIYPCGGLYRNATKQVKIEGSKHKIPHESLVKSLVCDLLETVNQAGSTPDDLDIAGYALWRLNWIHPFAGGNGRTARALTYLIICVLFGTMLPGVPTIPTLIAQRHADYTAALRSADSAAESGHPDASDIILLVYDCVIAQLESALAARRQRP